jgi:acetyltransferase-like isoleucine patch superfamily enzyme
MAAIKRILLKFISPLFKGYLYGVRFILGRRYVLYRLYGYSYLIGAAEVLKILGAVVGERTRIDPSIRIQNAIDGKCTNLQIGNHVYIGPGCLFDLASSIKIEDEAALSAQVSLVTHADVADRPLAVYFPRKEGPIVIGRGSWIGVNTTILHGVTVGQCSMVGAMSLVNRDIPDKVVAYGIPCRVVKSL